MEKNTTRRARGFLTRQRRHKRWLKVVSALGCIVVFCTTYALILPAITMEQETICGIEEHTHTDTCYATPKGTLDCDLDTLGIHSHSSDCYDEEGALICGYADYVVHTHDENCYDEYGDLVCTLPEVEEHTHDSSCYETQTVLTCGQEESEGHTHSDACYTTETVWDCTLEEHTHTDACYTVTQELSCAESEHSHTESCYDEEGKLICGQEEHTHSDACYTEVRTLTCGQEEHTHTDLCSHTERTLTCGQEESEGHTHTDSCYTTEQVLTCGELENHTHTDSCYDKDGNLTCGKLELVEHQHTADCWTAPESTDPVLICGQEEHTHSQECYADTEADIIADAAAEEGLSTGDEEIATADDTGDTTDSGDTTADHASVDFGPYITGSSVERLVNGSWQSATELTDGDTVRVTLNYTIPDSLLSADQRTITYQLPDGISPLTEQTGKVYDDGGNYVGDYTITTDGLITIVFLEDYVSTGEGFSGNIQFSGQASLGENEEEKEIEFDGDGGTITIKKAEETSDLSVKKTSALSDDGKTITYTVTASTTNGTGGTVTISDYFNSNTATATYDADSFTITKLGADGTETPIIGYTPTISSTTPQNFTISDLPQLEAGESYEVTYTAKVTGLASDGSGKISNQAYAESDGTKKNAWNEITVSSSAIEKSGVYHSDTDTIVWTITVSGSDLSGYTLTDIPGNGVTLDEKTTVTITDADGNTVDTITGADLLNGYTFTDTFTGTSYTITYTTAAPEGTGRFTATNEAELKKGDTGYSDTGTVTGTKRDYSVSKYWYTETASNGQTQYQWRVNVTLPSEELTSFTYTDTIIDATDGNGVTKPGSHYAIASQLQAAIEANLRLYLDSTNYVTYDNADYQFIVTYYDADGNVVSANDSTTHVVKFTIEVKSATEGGTFTAYRLYISHYPTIADQSDMGEGETWTWTNTGSVNNVDSTGSHSYTKPKTLSKQASATGDSTTYYDSLSTSMTQANGVIYYRILVNTTSNEDIILTDVLPAGMSYVEGSVSARFYANDNYEYASDSWYDSTGTYTYDFAGANAPTASVSDDNTLTITVGSGYNRDNEARTIVVYYQATVADDETWNDLTTESKSYTNTVTWGDSTASQETTVTRDVEELSKTGTQITETDDSGNVIYTNQVSYSVVINPAASDLDPDSDTLTLRDTLTLTNGVSAYLDLENTKLYYYDSSAADGLGAAVDTARYQLTYDEDSHTLTAVIPDSLACVLVYRYTVDTGTLASNPTITNNASLLGTEWSSSSSFQFHVTDSSATVTRGRLTIYKVDAEDYTYRLSGATFTLYSWTDSAWTEVGTYTTDENGELSFQGETGTGTDLLPTDTLYKLVETTAPTGYTATDTAYYFTWLNTGTTIDTIWNSLTDAVKAEIVDTSNIRQIGTGSAAIYVPNTYTAVNVKKVWLDSDGTELAGSGEIQIDLLQSVQKPDGYTVTINYNMLDYAFTPSLQRSVSYLVKKDGKITITVQNVAYNSEEAAANAFSVPAGWTFSYDTTTRVATIVSAEITGNMTVDIGRQYYYWQDDSFAVTYDEPDYITTSTVYDTVTLSSSNDWTHEWSTLPTEDDEGNPYYYTVQETTTLENYTVTYTNNGGITSGEIVVTNRKNETPTSYELPETGGLTTLPYTLGGLLLLAVTTPLLYRKTRRGKGGSTPS